MRSRALILLFFALYAAVAAGFALGFSDGAVAFERLSAAAVGALVVAVIFVVAASRQRSDLRGFVERLFGDVPRI